MKPSSYKSLSASMFCGRSNSGKGSISLKTTSCQPLVEINVRSRTLLYQVLRHRRDLGFGITVSSCGVQCASDTNLLPHEINAAIALEITQTEHLCIWSSDDFYKKVFLPRFVVS
jgi:hypothetical protein